MAEIVLDANVLVGYLDANDNHHRRAKALVERIDAEGHETVLLDVLVAEAVSVLCRRSRERKTNPPDLISILHRVRRWHADGEISTAEADIQQFFGDVLDVIEDTLGSLNFNDALLVVLQHEGSIDDVASFDEGFDQVEGFRRIA